MAGPSKKAKFKIYRQSESLFDHFSRLGTSQSASCSFCVVLEGFPTQKALASGAGSFQRSPIPPSWAGGVPPPAPSPGRLRLQPAPPLFSPPPQPSRLDSLVAPPDPLAGREGYYGFPWLRRNPSFPLSDDFGCLDL